MIIKHIDLKDIKDKCPVVIVFVGDDDDSELQLRAFPHLKNTEVFKYAPNEEQMTEFMISELPTTVLFSSDSATEFIRFEGHTSADEIATQISKFV